MSKHFIKYFATHFIYIVVLLGIIAFTIMGDSGLYNLHSMYKTKKMLAHQINENKSKIIHLEKEKKKLAQPDYTETIIRNELGYIKDGEVVFKITD